MIDKELKAKWVAALRSGKYTQIKHRFIDDHQPTSCCALGLLYEHCVGVAWHKLGEVFYLRREQKNPLSGASMKIIMNMNDGGKSFSYIADYIESNL